MVEGTQTRKFLLITFLVILIIGGFSVFFQIRVDSVGAATNVNGIINSDTTWSKANSPYIVTEPILVKSGVTLTIDPGVTVYFNDTYLKVNGTLNARGTNIEKIFFISNGTNLGFQMSVANGGIVIFSSTSSAWNEETKSGCIIENVFFTSTQFIPTINVNNASPKINKCTIINTGGQRAILVNKGSPTISNSTMKDSNSGLSFIDNNNAVVSDNVISSCQVGIEVYAGSPIIERNLIINNTGNKIGGNGGIRIDYAGTSPIIRNNTITRNSVGINLLSSPSPIISNNSFLLNLEYNIYLYSGSISTNTADINAANNWWGTTNEQAISQTIRDNKNDFNLGTVTFTPYLSSPTAPPNSSKQYVTDYLENIGFDVTFVYFGSGPIGFGAEDCAVVIMKTNEHVKNFQFSSVQELQFREGNNSLKLAYPSAEVFVTGFFEDLDNNGVPDASISGGSSYRDMSGSGYGGKSQDSFGPTYWANANDYVGTYGSPQTPSPMPAPTYIITLAHIGSGSVSLSDGTHSVTSPLTLSAYPAPNYNFMCWLRNGVFLSEKSPYTFTVSSNSVITAVFYPQNAPADIISLTGVTVTSGGSGYTTPVIILSGGGGTGATAIARVSNGVINNIILTNPGSGYTSPPTLRISDPSPRANGASAEVSFAYP